jgi:hypothetical protein
MTTTTIVMTTAITVIMYGVLRFHFVMTSPTSWW